MGEPWHPTQLGVHSRQNEAKAKDEYLSMDKWLNMAIEDSETLGRTPDTSGSEPRLIATARLLWNNSRT